MTKNKIEKQKSWMEESRCLNINCGIHHWHRIAILNILIKARKEEKERILEELEKWNQSGYMADCLGQLYWKELIKIIENK